MVKTYSFLLIAIFCEVAGTMLLPVSQNFTKIIPTVCLTIFYLVSFYLMTFVMDKLPIAIVYATWSGLGVFTIALLGYFFFKQTLAWQAIAGLFLIVIGVILVNSFTVKISYILKGCPQVHLKSFHLSSLFYQRLLSLQVFL